MGVLIMANIGSMICYRKVITESHTVAAVPAAYYPHCVAYDRQVGVWLLTASQCTGLTGL
jgi:hypothetical protein